MKKIRLLAFSSIIVALSFFLSGYSAAAEKIGFIDMREIIFNSDAGKQAAAEFRKTFEKKKAAIQQKEAELKRQKDDLEKKRSVLREEAMKEKELEYQKQFREYQRLVSDSNEELSARDQQLSSRLIPEILKIVNSFGEREGYTLILDVNNPIVAYHSKGNNLTKKIIAEFNRTQKNRR